ncbi:Protein translocase subunit SecD [Candidatus Hoaglandella endobia]|uniref:Protein translocase subunit SecD n=2 Tax=Candidatus Hoaglandella endobia TaxID=1778263 RepID=A0A143WTA2_9ENTR|nr:Protein translocase subunit SecD [Candidatus Hoaglandella endobia]
MLVLVLSVGLLYALPNFYGEDPAVQITGRYSSAVNDSTLVQIRQILKQQHIASKSISLKNGAILIRYANSDVQLRAREALMNVLNKNYIIALNLVPATPAWLTILGASPMKLGLDLRGGVHFLIEIDMDTVLVKLQKKKIDNLLSELHKNGMAYMTVRRIKNYDSNYGSDILFHNTATRDQASSWALLHHRDLVIKNVGNNALHVTLAYKQLREASEYAVQQSIAILRNRVNQLGVAEPLVQRYGAARIVVELPGIQDMARAKEILGTTATLEFRLVNNSVDQTAVVNGHVPRDSEVKFNRDGQPFVLYKRVILDGNHIIDSNYSADNYNRPQVNIFLDSVGGTIMSNFTKVSIGKQIATLFVTYKDSGKQDAHGRSIMVKKEEVINVATIQSRLRNSFRITGLNNLNEAHHLSLLLRAGALIAPIQIVEERNIGPTLGRQNITQGVEACLWGLVSSILFMVGCYRKFGFIATTALIANLLLIIGIISLLPGATLTMPGIAGIVLTLAVAVDANVLINERIKEELRNGRKVQKAIHEGYRMALPSIIDANMTTLITASILYYMGTGSIKGFAITTAIGVATSMFTAIICTRALVNLLYGEKRINKLSI